MADTSMVGYMGLYAKCRYSAKVRGYEFRISLTEFFQLVTKNCAYCDAKPIPKRSKTKRYNMYLPPHNGIDRVDNTRGYVKDNCVPCCGTCNSMKGSMELKQFLLMAKSIYEKHRDSK